MKTFLLIQFQSTQVHCGGWGLFDLGSFSKIFARGVAVSSNNTLFKQCLSIIILYVDNVIVTMDE